MDIETGVRQGCILSSLFSVIYNRFRDAKSTCFHSTKNRFILFIFILFIYISDVEGIEIGSELMVTNLAYADGDDMCFCYL